jgi:hypothetical protein
MFECMEELEPDASVLVGATSRPRVGLVWWVVVFGVVTTGGLGALALGLFLLHALGYGAVAVLAPQAGAAAPDGGRHVLAFALGVVVQIAAASAATVLAPRTVLHTWRPVALGLAASLVAAMLASCALLLTVGISPVALLLDR